MIGRVRLPRSRQSTLRARGRGGMPARAFDVAGAAALLFGLAPLMLLVAALICLVDRAAPLQSARRVGRGGVAFPCLSYRTMASRFR